MNRAFANPKPRCDLFRRLAFPSGEFEDFSAANRQVIDRLDGELELIVGVGGFGGILSSIQDSPGRQFIYRDRRKKPAAAENRKRRVAREGKDIGLLGESDFSSRAGIQQLEILLLNDVVGVDGWKLRPEIAAQGVFVRLHVLREPALTIHGIGQDRGYGRGAHGLGRLRSRGGRATTSSNGPPTTNASKFLCS